MPRLTETDGLTDVQRDILGAVREFVDAEIIPVAGDLDRTDTYPDQIVAGLRELGVFGLTIDPEYGGLGESLLTYALVAEEIARGWMSISGIINTHFIVAYLISRHGTAEQKAASCPRWPPVRSGRPSPCPSPASGPTWPRSGPRPGATGTTT